MKKHQQKISTIKIPVLKKLKKAAAKTFVLFAFTAFLGSLSAIPLAGAALYNFGTLDLKPLSTQNEWFVETIKPGDKKQEQLQISNFASSPKQITLYVSDAAGNQKGNFFAKNLEQKSEDIIDWIKLPANSLTLQPGESKILSVNFELPANAGVGLHTGAIIAREIRAGSNTEAPLNIEKGVRVYLTVPGTALSRLELNKSRLQDQPGQTALQLTVKNTGTADYRTNFSLDYRNNFAAPVAKADSGQPVAGSSFQENNFSFDPPTPGQVLIKPAQTKTITLTAPKPAFGLYTLMLSDGKQSAPLQHTIFIPLWALLALMAPFAIYSVIKNKDRLRLRINLTSLPALGFNYAKTNQLALAKNISFLGIFALVIFTTLSIPYLEAGLLQTDVLRPKTASSYQMTVKWGNLRGITLPDTYTYKWNGQITFQNAQINLKELLNMEGTDSVQVNHNNTTLIFNNQTGPDNDGAIINITPTSETEPTLIFENFNNGIRQEYKISELVADPIIIPNGFFAVYLKAELGPEKMLAAVTPGQELNATPELEATPPPTANIPELNNLFIEEIPATPEALSNFILTSDYVNKISTDNQTAKVETATILLKALEATPQVLNEIAATPDLNFIFIPSEKINFPPQEFSFSQDKTTTQNLGPIIFVQNKNTAWNTYVGTTEFKSLSGKAVIPASALTIIPGEAKVIGKRDGAVIKTGDTRTFSGTFDKSILVDVQPGKDNQQIFVLNSVLQIKIPPHTLPGRYHGTLTITSL